MTERGCILVADDDRNVRTVLSIRLRAEGYDVIEAADGFAALDRVKQGGIDVLILDAIMPGMDGFEVFRNLQKFNDCPSVIFLTALGDHDRRLKALQGITADRVAKPIVPSELFARVAAAVDKRRRTQKPPTGASCPPEGLEL